MGMLINGEWVEKENDARRREGAFFRADAHFRNFISADGSTGFAAEADRYHLYVSRACPWAHRTMIVRKLKGLEDAISISYVLPLMLANGWELAEPDKIVPGARYSHNIYQAADANYTGRASVPILWDKKNKTIVSNESAEIIRMFNSEFREIRQQGDDLYPAELRGEIDGVNERIYNTLNNGVYRCGFATAQERYEEVFDALFETLDYLEDRLAAQRYLLGTRLTEADWRLFTTLVRFDAVYFGHFKCNLRRIADYPNLSHYLRDLYQHPGIAETVALDECKTHYYGSHEGVNPTRIVPKGPAFDLDKPHDRDKFPD
jgi:putative glutathione S-transferase